jgi:MoaA/NifB/PqqE/SkfB family radical SAM enzyme
MDTSTLSESLHRFGWSSALRAYAALKSVGIPVAMNTNINRRNRGEIERIFELAREQAVT